MNDLISRKALLDDFRKTITEQSDTTDWLNMINRQPSVGDNRWIPVSVRLPKQRKDVLVTYKTGDVGKDFIHENGEWFWEDGEERLVVTAWQPLPDPWEGDIQ